MTLIIDAEMQLQQLIGEGDSSETSMPEHREQVAVPNNEADDVSCAEMDDSSAARMDAALLEDAKDNTAVGSCDADTDRIIKHNSPLHHSSLDLLPRYDKSMEQSAGAGEPLPTISTTVGSHEGDSVSPSQNEAAVPQHHTPDATTSHNPPFTPTPDGSDSSTTAISSSQTPTAQQPLLVYNPLTSYSPGGRASPRKQIMGMSIPVLRTSTSKDVHGSAIHFIQTPQCKNRIPPGDDDILDDGVTDDSSAGSEVALERWSRQIRMELRQAEMLELAVAAEHAAESGLETFAAKLSTYGQDDSLVTPPTFQSTGRPLNIMQQGRTLSEGTKIAIRRAASNAKIGVLGLRDVDEVFPPFKKFHSHLRTHLLRSQVNEKSLHFKESKKVRKDWGAPPSPDGSHSRSPSDFFTHRRSPSDFFKHRRGPSDFFGQSHSSGMSDPGRHRRAPSDFFQSLNLERFLSQRGSSDTADSVEVVDMVAEHIHDPSSTKRRLPELVVPEGLEIPVIENPSSITDKERRSSDQTLDTQQTGSSSEQQTKMATKPRDLSPRALFDHDDEEGESDGDSIGDAGLFGVNRSIVRASNTALTPVVDHSDDIIAVNGPDFLTPARLRVIRDSGQAIERVQASLDGLLLTHNSVLEQNGKEDKQSSLQYRGSNQPEADMPSSSILLPRYLGEAQDERRKIGVSFKPRTSSSLDCSSHGVIVSDNSQLEKHPNESTEDVLQDNLIPMSSNNVVPTHNCPQIRVGAVNESADGCVRQEDIEKLDNSLLETPPRRGLGQEMRWDEHTVDRNDVTDSECHITPTGNRAVVTHGASPDSGRSEVSGGGSEIIQHSQTLLVHGPDDTKLDHGPALETDCACLGMSPPCSPVSDTKTSAVSKADTFGSPNTMRRSSSAGALASLDSPRSKWNPFSSRSREDKSKPFHAAMSIFSRISPRTHSKKTYMKARENDDFLHNYLYCSKPGEGMDGRAETTAEPACVDVNTDMCCGSFLPDTSFGALLSNNGRSNGGPLISLSGDQYSKIEPETWFDMANERFDGVLEHLSGRGRQESSPWNISFQAPTLRKAADVQQQKARTYSIVDDGEEEAGKDEEKKSDSSSIRSSNSGKHSRHMSCFPSAQGPQFALSDKQFELIYGVTPEAFANSLSRNIAASQNSSVEDRSDALSDEDSAKQVEEQDASNDREEVKDALDEESYQLAVDTSEDCVDEFDSLPVAQTF